MRVSHGEDLGLGLVAVVAFLLFVTILALVVRKKWTATLARTEEVRRLLAMASEETIRVEMEHAFGYRSEKDLPAVSVGGTDGNGSLRLCAVCYSPTTTRCSRCKAVRYCSGKCQIIHWRQGHKDKCRPPEIQCNPVGAYSDRTTSAANSKSSGGVMESFVTEPTKTHLVDHTPSSFVCSTSAIHKEDDAEVCDLVKKCVSEGNSGPTSDPSLGCATFASGSVCLETSPESIKSHPSSTINTENSSSDASSNSSKSSEELCEVSQRNPSLHEIATSTIPVDRLSSLDELNQQVTVCSTEELACKPVVDPRMSGSRGSTNVTCSSCQDMTSETILSNSGNGDLSRSNSSKEDVGVNLDSKIASHFILSDDAVSSQLNSGSRLNLNGNVSSKTISYSKTKDPYFDAPASAINGKNSSESLLKYRQSKTHAIAVSESIYGGGGNNVSDSKNFSSFSSSTTELTKNNISVSNGGHALKSVRKVVQQLKSSKPSKFCKIIPPYDLYIKLYNEKVDLQPRGLINCGNSCYANVVLQCLAFTRPLTAYLLQRIHSRTCLKKEWCFTCEFENLVVNVKQGKSPLSPIGILSQIHNLGSSLGHGKQEDAHEFLRYAIDAMQSMCLKETRNPGGQHFVETTFIDIIFGGYLRSRIKCMNCQTTSDRYEKMMDLTVEVHGDGDIRTLDEALARFTAIEILDGENKYKCGRCKSYEKAKKKLSVLEAPNVLTIALKRFQSGKFGKLNKTVQFPEVLNMSRYMCSGSHDKTPVYCLYAVVVHVDIMNAAFSGHYVCYVKSAQNKWYKLDDSTVKPVEPDRVLSKGAYMLLYAKISPRAPRISRNEIPCRPAQGKSRKLPESGPKWRSNPDCAAVDGSIYDNSHIPLGQRTSKRVDSSSDSSGLSFSDECSCSTESTRDSTSTDDYSDLLFGESCGLNCYSPSRVSGDSDGFITYSPSAHGMSNGWMPDFLGGSDSATDMSSLDEGDTHHHHQMGGVSYASTSELEWKHHDGRRGWSTQGKESSPFLHSDTTTKPCVNLTESRSSRETNWDTVLHKRTTRSGAAQAHL